MNRSRTARGRSGACCATEIEAERFSKDDLPSPAPQMPKFLKGMPKRGVLYSPQQRITIRLKEIIEAYSYQAAFESAISAVRRHRLEELKAIHTLDQFYFYLDQLVTWVPGLRIWEWQGTVYHERTDYLRLTQFYFYFNQPELEGLQSPIDPVKGKKLTPLSRWLRDFAVELGSFMDDEGSIAYLETYKFGPAYSYQDYAGGEDGLQGYKTFNQWFSRTFKDIDVQRPIAQPDNDRVIAFPAESTFVGQWAISTPVPSSEPLPQKSSIVVKHVEWPIAELLGDSEHAADFEGGLFMHSFLNIYDYHRQHAPVSGKILEAKFIPGQAYLEVDLEILDKEQRADENSALAYAVSQRRHLDAEDSTGYQFVQCRGLMVLESAVGKIAVLPMGMGYVSSVVFATPASEGPQKLIRLSDEEKRGLSYEEQIALINEKVEKALVNKTVKKGDMISSFLFGGSDIVMVFERKSNVTITAKAGVHYPIRSQIAVSNIAELATD
jgi:phosphatidylserine decarboxylase